MFHNGIQVAPFVDFTSEGSNFRGKQRKAEFGGKGINDLYTTRVGSDFLLPLMRGRGSDAIAAGERAATVEAQAGTLDVEHQRASSILRTAQAYWELRAAQESLAILERSVTPPGRPAEGDHRARQRRRAGPGRARPVAGRRSPRPRPRPRRAAAPSTTPAWSWPTPSASPAAAPTPRCRPRPRIRSRWRRTPPRCSRGSGPPPRPASAGTSKRRCAARKPPSSCSAAPRPTCARGSTCRRRCSTRRSAKSATSPTEDQDENGRPIYRRDGFAEAYDRWVGPSFTLTLNYEKPLGNNSAKGRLAAREAERRTRAIETGDLRRQVRLNVARTATALIETIGRLKRRSRRRSTTTRRSPRSWSRFRAGEATLINTITTEQQATETDLSLIAAQQAVANLLAQLRFESGTLVTNSTVSAPTLVSLPAATGSDR